MAVGSLLIRPNAVSPATMQLATLSRRSLSYSSRVGNGLRAASSPLTVNSRRQLVQRTFRRSYADSAPEPQPKKRFRFLRWTYRLTLLAGLGLTGWTAYSIYVLNNPEEQYQPDPDKKTLVILGKSRSTVGE